MKQCKYPECNDKTGKLSLGWCKRHYDRWRRSGSPKFPEPIGLLQKILMRTKKNGDCLIWQGCKDEKGRGLINLQGSKRVHRVLWEIINGSIPEGLVIRHACDVPSCINIKHLLIGTQRDNMNDMKIRGRGRRIICRNGLHELQGSNIYTLPSNPDYRECRECRNERNKRYHSKKKRGDENAETRKVA